MLLTKIVIIKWEYKTKKWYEYKGYVFTKYDYEFEVKVEDLSDGSHVLVDVECDGCGEILKNKKWQNYKRYVKDDEKYYCQKCANNGYKKWISFFEWCYLNLSKEDADKLLERWDYELNINEDNKIITPKDVTCSSMGFNKKGYWFKCLDHPDEHGSEQKNIKSFISGHIGSINCNQCNSISTTHPHLVEYLENKEDANIYSKGSHKKLPMKCPNCGYEKKMSINDLRRQGFGCNKCSDGVSYPNKFMFNILEQIKNLKIIEDFETEKTFDWLIYEFKDKLHKGKLDFYFKFNGKKYNFEMDGAFHSKDNAMNGQTKEESKYIDDEKDKLCGEHEIEVIRINCDESKMRWIKDNVMESNLPNFLNFKESDIDWLECHEYACSSLVKVVCDLWNNGTNSSLIISKKLKIGKNTTTRYLKQGVELGWCNYDSKKEIIKNYKRLSKTIICITTKEIFNSIIDACRKYKLFDANIISCCQGKNKSSGKHPVTGEKLIWAYYDKFL